TAGSPAGGEFPFASLRPEPAGIASVGPMRTTRTSTVLIAGLSAVALLGAAACSSDGSATAPSDTAAAGQHGPAPENTGSPGPAVPATTGQSRASAPRIVLDGDERHFDFDQIQCDWGTDDGYPQLEYEAESHSEDAELEVEIVMSDPPTID